MWDITTVGRKKWPLNKVKHPFNHSYHNNKHLGHLRLVRDLDSQTSDKLVEIKELISFAQYTGSY